MTARSTAILERFPRHMALTDPGKRFGDVVAALAADLDVLTRQVGDVRKAHRVDDAGTRADLLGLAALHDLNAAAFELVRLRMTALAAAGTDTDSDAVSGLVHVPAGTLTDLGPGLAGVVAQSTRHRARMEVERLVLLGAIGAYVAGNATPAAILGATAAYLGFGILEVTHTEERWWHLATCSDTVRLQLPPAPTPDPAAPPPPPPPNLTPLPDVIALEENPFRAADLDPTPRRHGQRFRILRGGLDDVDVAVRVVGIGLRTVRPMVVHIDSGHGVVFEGNVPDGQELVFGASGQVTLSGAEVTGSAWSFIGGVYASTTEALLNHDFLLTDDDGNLPPDANGPPATFAVASPLATAFESAAGFPHGAAAVGPLRLPLGESRWATFVRAGHYATSVSEPALPRTDEGRFDQSVFTETWGIPDPSLEVGFSWEEREPFAVRVLIPQRLAALDDDAGTVIRQPLRALLDNHRAAGVELRVEYADPRWTLGSGVVREGVDDPLGIVLAGTEPGPTRTPTREPDDEEMRMALTKPPLVNVSPGEPVTASGWNALVTGLSALYDAVIALGGAVLEVAVAAGSNPLPGAKVIAEPLGEGNVVQALPPFGSRTNHLLAGLTDGPWRIHIEAPGFTSETRDVTLPHPEPLAVTMTLAGVVVPDLFGTGTQSALDQVRALGIDVDMLLDTTGREVSRTTLPPEYVDSPILLQLPDAGTVVPSGTGRVRLVTSSALRREPVVTMPSLAGLTLGEANEVLERLGLRLGTTDLRD